MATLSFMNGTYATIFRLASGVLNTKLMSVLERTREPGAMKAQGLQPSQVAKIVFIDSPVHGAWDLPRTILYTVVAVAFCVAAAAYPAWRISRTSPAGSSKTWAS